MNRINHIVTFLFIALFLLTSAGCKDEFSDFCTVLCIVSDVFEIVAHHAADDVEENDWDDEAINDPVCHEGDEESDVDIDNSPGNTGTNENEEYIHEPTKDERNSYTPPGPVREKRPFNKR